MDILLPVQIELRVVTPERMVVSATTSSVSLPGASGRLGVLPGHAPLVSELSAGVLSYEQNGEAHVFAVSQGFTEVLQGRVIVLVQTAEKAEDIDLERAQRAKQRAEDRLKNIGDAAIDTERAQAALNRAVARVEAAESSPRDTRAARTP